MEFKTNEEAIAWVRYLPYNQQDAIYRHLRSNRVKEDVVSHCKTLGIKFNDETLNEIVHRYVYKEDYDTDLGYFDNLERLMNEYLGEKSNEKII